MTATERTSRAYIRCEHVSETNAICCECVTQAITAAEKAAAGGELHDHDCDVMTTDIPHRCTCGADDQAYEDLCAKAPARGGLREAAENLMAHLSGKSKACSVCGVKKRPHVQSHWCAVLEAALAAPEGEEKPGVLEASGPAECGCWIMYEAYPDEDKKGFRVYTSCKVHTPAPVRTPAGDNLAKKVGKYVEGRDNKIEDVRAYEEMVEAHCAYALSNLRAAPPGPSAEEAGR